MLLSCDASLPSTGLLLAIAAPALLIVLLNLSHLHELVLEQCGSLDDGVLADMGMLLVGLKKMTLKGAEVRGWECKRAK